MDRDRSAIAAAQLPLRRNADSGSGIPPMPRPSSGARSQPPPQQHWLGNASRDGSVPNGVLLGSLAEYLPTSAVAYANTAAAGSGAPSASPTIGGNSHQVRRSAPVPLEAQSLSMLHGSQIISEHTSPRVRPNGVRASSSGAPPLAPSPTQRPPQKGLPPHSVSQDVVLPRSGSNDVAGSQDLRSSKQSITVLSVTRDGRAQEWPRPPSSTSTAQARGESTPAPIVRPAPAQPPRHASLNKVSSASSTPRGSVTGRVQVETIAPINETSLSTASTVHPAMPAPIAAAELRQRTTQQQQQQPSAPVPRPPRHSSVVSNGSTVYIQQQPPQSRTSPNVSPAHAAASHPARVPAARPAPTPNSMPPAAQPSASGASNASSNTPRGNGVEAEALVPRAHPTHHTQQQQQHGAVLHHRPAYATTAAVRQAGEPLPTGPATLQVSTTTLTKATKKVRYLLPDEPFDPDAPDPSDGNGLTAAEEAALLDPVQYTRAADEVAGRYPMLLRRASAQGGDLLRTRRNSGSAVLDPDAPHPTFLLDDGNRWARETNRPTVATTRDPSGTAATQLPSPSILRKGGAGKGAGEAPQEAFPAYQRVSAHGSSGGSAGVDEAGGYLLQRHVQQMAIGKQLVQGTAFQPPPTGKRHLERRQREQEEARLDAQLAAAASGKRNGATAGLPPTAPQRRGTLEGLYDEVVRRSHQNRRAALPTTSQGTAAAPPAALPLPPASGERRRARPHPASAEPTPLHRGAGRAAQGESTQQPHPPSGYPTSYLHAVAALPPQQQQQQQPARSSSQPYITSAYHYDETPSGSELGSRDGYRTPLMYAGAAPQAPPQQQQDARAPPALPRTYAAAPPPPRPHPPPPHQQHQTQYYAPYYPEQPSSAASSARAAPGQRPAGPKTPQQQQDSPPPRQQHEPPQQQQPAPYAPAHYSSAAPVPSSSSNGSARMPGYTSGRFSKYNSAVPAAAHLPTSEEHYYSSNSGDRCDSAPGTDGHVGSAEGSWRAHPPQQQQYAPAYTSATKPRPQLPRQPQPQRPQPQQQQQREEAAAVYTYAEQQQPSQMEEADEDDYSDRYAREDETAEDQQQRQLDEYDEYDGSPYPAEDSFSEEPVTDAASQRTPRPQQPQQQQRPAAPANGSSDREDDAASASGGSGGAGAAVAEVRRSLLDQYKRATYVPAPPDTVVLRAQQPPQLRTDDIPPETLDRPHREARSHHSHRSTATSSATSSPPYPPAVAAPSVSSARRSAASASTRPGERDAASTRASSGSAPIRGSAPPPPANADTAGGHDASFASSDNVSSCDTDTQPIAVSEFDEDELAEAEGDELTKKGPPLLVLGDEVYAPEGFDYVQQQAEADEVAADGAVAPEEEEYWAGEQAAAPDGHDPQQEQHDGFYHDDDEDEELPVPGGAHREL